MDHEQKLNVKCTHCLVTNRVPAIRLSDHPTCGRCKQRLFTGAPASVDGGQLQQIIHQSDIPIVVDFWAAWCGPCRMFAPNYERAAAELEPQYLLLKLDTEANRSFAAAHHIVSIPTLAVFRQGAEVARQAGIMPLGDFVRWVRAC